MLAKSITLKIMLDRLRYYASMIQFAMISYLFIKQTEWNLASTTLLVGIASIIIMYLDWKYILPKEQGRYWSKNPFAVKILNKLDKIEKEVGECYHGS